MTRGTGVPRYKPVGVSPNDYVLIDAIRLSLSNSITYVFLIDAAFVAVAFFTSVLIRNEPLKTAQENHEELDAGNA